MLLHSKAASRGRRYLMPTRSGQLYAREAAEILGVHPNTIRNWALSGELPAEWVRPRQNPRFNPDVIERFRREREARQQVVDDQTAWRIVRRLYDETGTLYPEVQHGVEDSIKRFPNMEADMWLGGVAAIQTVLELLGIDTNRLYQAAPERAHG
jgi:hypothetical protein